MSKLPFEQLGPYRIERPIGTGGMGSVFLGTDDETGQQAAVKVLAPALAANENFRTRFGTEVETLKKLKHPNIVQLLGFGEQDGQLFYAMEYVDGRSLQQELRSARRFSWREVTRMGVEMCQALKHAHDRGVIHRDLKPANLVYTEDGHVKLLDFGIAKLYGMTQVTVVGGVLGTVDFMAPEQAMGSGVTARSDLYSLGAVLYTLLAGRPPFVARSVPEVMHKVQYEEAPPVRSLAPDTPEEFEQIITQLLHKDPHERIATALAVANRLKAMEFALSMETRVDAEPQEQSASDSGEYELASDENNGSTIDSLLPLPGNGPSAKDRLLDDDSLQRHRSSTIAMSDLHGVDQEEADDDAEGAQSTHFTTFDEEARRRATRPLGSEETAPLWQRVGPLAAAAVIIAFAIWYFTRPPSADKLYARISAVAEEGETRELARVGNTIDRFISSFPTDSRMEEVQAWKDDLELYRKQKMYRNRVRMHGGIQSLSPVERAYTTAMDLAARDPASAVRKLQALLDIYETGDSKDKNKDCLELAREQLQQLREQAEQFLAQQLKQLAERLDVADQLEKTEPAKADAIRRGIVELYGDQPWAQPMVERAQSQLASPASES